MKKIKLELLLVGLTIIGACMVNVGCTHWEGTRLLDSAFVYDNIDDNAVEAVKISDVDYTYIPTASTPSTVGAVSAIASASASASSCASAGVTIPCSP